MQKFQITQDDIDKGLRRVASACAGAQAIKRVYPDAYPLTVTQGKVFIGHDEYPTPRQLADFIARYDADLEVQPIEFTLA